MSEINEVERLKKAYEIAKRIAVEAEETLHAEMLRINPLQPGDIIQSQTGELAKITSLWVELGRVKMTAVLKNNNGQWGKRPAPLGRSEWSGGNWPPQFVKVPARCEGDV